MKKKVIPLILVFVMVLSFSSYAVMQISRVTPTLLISGTTATCSVAISDANNYDIDVTLELWCGNTLVDSWRDGGAGYVRIKETCKVTRGNTYTLIASGTINGSPFESAPVEKTCK